MLGVGDSLKINCPSCQKFVELVLRLDDSVLGVVDPTGSLSHPPLGVLDLRGGLGDAPQAGLVLGLCVIEGSGGVEDGGPGAGLLLLALVEDLEGALEFLKGRV